MITKSIDIWGDIEYKYKRDGFIPTLDSYILKGDRKRPAIIVCPGGGYTHLSEREGEAIAIQYNAMGYHAFVLNYSVIPRKHPQPLLDLSRSICLLRENAESFNIDSDSIAVIGFSAGGHLAACMGAHWNKPYLLKQEGITKGLNKPNALILCYAFITEKGIPIDYFKRILEEDAPKSAYDEMSIENNITEDMPPCFIWHTLTDEKVPVENCLLLANALRQKNVPFELHIYPEGPHGMALATPETGKLQKGVESWMELCKTWLNITFNEF